MAGGKDLHPRLFDDAQTHHLGIIVFLLFASLQNTSCPRSFAKFYHCDDIRSFLQKKPMIVYGIDRSHTSACPYFSNYGVQWMVFLALPVHI
jgi:hypothetical protein